MIEWFAATVHDGCNKKKKAMPGLRMRCKMKIETRESRTQFTVVCTQHIIFFCNFCSEKHFYGRRRRTSERNNRKLCEPWTLVIRTARPTVVLVCAVRCQHNDFDSFCQFFSGWRFANYSMHECDALSSLSAVWSVRPCPVHKVGGGGGGCWCEVEVHLHGNWIYSPECNMFKHSCARLDTCCTRCALIHSFMRHFKGEHFTGIIHHASCELREMHNSTCIICQIKTIFRCTLYTAYEPVPREFYFKKLLFYLHEQRALHAGICAMPSFH